MNKEQLRTQYIGEGWGVVPVNQWVLVENREGVVLYDVDVVTPTGTFTTAQVIVTDDGGANEDAKPKGRLEVIKTFRQAAREFLDSREGGQIFAIAIVATYEQDEIVEAKAYRTDNTTRLYVVKRRNDTFSFQQTA